MPHVFGASVLTGGSTRSPRLRAGRQRPWRARLAEQAPPARKADTENSYSGRHRAWNHTRPELSACHDLRLNRNPRTRGGSVPWNEDPSMASTGARRTPQTYPDELRERAVRNVLEIREQTGQHHGAVARVAKEFGTRNESLRGWVNITPSWWSAGPDLMLDEIRSPG
jgi:hypothetical protein